MSEFGPGLAPPAPKPKTTILTESLPRQEAVRPDLRRREKNFRENRTPEEQIDDALGAIAKSEDSFSSSPDGQLVAALSSTGNERAIVASLGIMEGTLRAQKNPDAQNFRIARRVIGERVMITIGSERLPLSQLETELNGKTTTPERKVEIRAAIENGLSTQTILGEVADEVTSGSAQTLTGDNLRSVAQAMKAYSNQIPDQASEAAKAGRSAYERVSEVTFVTYGGKLHSLSDLETERATAEPKRAEEIDRIIQGGTYERPLDELGTGRRLIDQEIPEQIKVLEAKENRSGNEEAILQRLKGLTGGNARDAIAVTAFKQLKAMGVGGLNSVIARGEAAELDSLGRITRALESNKYTQDQMRTIVPVILNGNLQALMNWEVLGKPGVDLLFFEQNKTDAELQGAVESMFPQEAKSIWARHSRNAGIVVLLMLMMGSGPLARMFEEKHPRAA